MMYELRDAKFREAERLRALDTPFHQAESPEAAVLLEGHEGSVTVGPFTTAAGPYYLEYIQPPLPRPPRERRRGSYARRMMHERIRVRHVLMDHDPAGEPCAPQPIDEMPMPALLLAMGHLHAARGWAEAYLRGREGLRFRVSDDDGTRVRVAEDDVELDAVEASASVRGTR